MSVVPKSSAKIIAIIFLVTSSVYGQTSGNSSDCLECHSDATELKILSSVDGISPISHDFSDGSVHKDIGCVGCHADPGGYPHPEIVGTIECSECHQDESADYLSSVHGNPLTSSTTEYPKCWDCHKLHLMKSSSDAGSAVNRSIEWKTCTECHASVENSDTEFVSFTNGIHSSVIKNDPTENSLTCTDCHGSHLLSKIVGGEWRLDHLSEQEYCKGCHEKESVEYENSPHATAKLMSNSGEVSLVCSDCHEEHEDIRTEGKRKELSSHMITDKCIQCHSPVLLYSRYASKARGYTPNLSSLHGVKNLMGEIVFTNCSSCHGIHEIEAFNTTDSIIRVELIANKCGNCHPMVSADLSIYRVHLSAMEPVETEIFYFRLAMKVIIGLTILLISITIFSDLYRVIRRKIK